MDEVERFQRAIFLLLRGSAEAQCVAKGSNITLQMLSFHEKAADMAGQNAAIVFKRGDGRPLDGGLQIGAVMKLGVPVALWAMVASQPYCGFRGGKPAHLQAFDVQRLVVGDKYLSQQPQAALVRRVKQIQCGVHILPV